MIREGSQGVGNIITQSDIAPGIDNITCLRYIEVFSSSMNEAKAAQQNMQGRGFGPMRGGPGGPGPMMLGPGPRGGPMMRPGPYDRQR